MVRALSFFFLSIPAGRNDREGQNEVWTGGWGDRVDTGRVARRLGGREKVCDELCVGRGLARVHICARGAQRAVKITIVSLSVVKAFDRFSDQPHRRQPQVYTYGEGQ